MLMFVPNVKMLIEFSDEIRNDSLNSLDQANDSLSIKDFISFS
jgi:hypothetical protein